MDPREALEKLKQETLFCPHCPQVKERHRIVPGEGNPEARVMLVGQGPGEVEDRLGRPFVGPAGKLLDEALGAAGMKREELWITNIIKCWTFRREGRRAVNRAPYAGEVRACAPWLETELRLIQPKIVVCIGGPAAQALIDKKFRITEERGQWREGPFGTRAIATLHPSYLIRLRENSPPAYERAWSEFVDDLRRVAEAAREEGMRPDEADQPDE